MFDDAALSRYSYPVADRSSWIKFSISREIREAVSFGDDFDLLKFCVVQTKELRHFDYLVRTDEVRGISAELLDARRKLAASPGFRDIHSCSASAVFIMQTEFANDHYDP